MDLVAGALTFTWLGMVLAISFLEAPLKFRAPEVTTRIGLGIGRIVFRALNLVESVLAVVILVLAVLAPAAGPLWFSGGAFVVLLVQLAIVRPRLNKRSDRILAGEELPRSREHFVYIGLETLKVLLLIGLGVTALA